MSRKEEINTATYNALETNYLMEDSKNAFLGGFNIGAEWADKTMLDKACKWLQLWIGLDDNKIKRFRKDMEE